MASRPLTAEVLQEVRLRPDFRRDARGSKGRSTAPGPEVTVNAEPVPRASVVTASEPSVKSALVAPSLLGLKPVKSAVPAIFSP